MKKHIAPRLDNGQKRERVYNALPPAVKKAVALIAAANKRSTSWELETLVYTALGVKQPKFKTRQKERNKFVPMRRLG